MTPTPESREGNAGETVAQWSRAQVRPEYDQHCRSRTREMVSLVQVTKQFLVPTKSFLLPNEEALKPSPDISPTGSKKEFGHVGISHRLYLPSGLQGELSRDA